jgi:hypothetical protein
MAGATPGGDATARTPADVDDIVRNQVNGRSPGRRTRPADRCRRAQTGPDTSEVHRACASSPIESLGPRSRTQGDRRGAPDSRDSTTDNTGLQGLRRWCAFVVVAVGLQLAEDGVCGLIFGCLARSVPRLKVRLARTQLCVRGSLRGCAEATYQPVIGQRDTTGLRHLEINRPQLQHDPAVAVHRALDPLRLRVVESHHVTRRDVPRRDVLYRHRPTVGRRGAEWPARGLAPPAVCSA